MLIGRTVFLEKDTAGSHVCRTVQHQSDYLWQPVFSGNPPSMIVIVDYIGSRIPVLAASNLNRRDFQARFLQDTLLPGRRFYHNIVFLFPRKQSMFSIRQRLPFKRLRADFRFTGEQTLCCRFHRNLTGFLRRTDKCETNATFHLLRIDTDTADRISDQHSFTRHQNPDFLSRVVDQRTVLVTDLKVDRNHIRAVGNRDNAIRLNVHNQTIGFSRSAHTVGCHNLSVNQRFRL